MLFVPHAVVFVLNTERINQGLNVGVVKAVQVSIHLKLIIHQSS